MSTEAKVPHRIGPSRRAGLVLLIWSAVGFALNVITFYGWVFLWSWASPLINSLTLVTASLLLWSGKWWSYLLAAVLSTYAFYDLDYVSLVYWELREHWSAGVIDLLRQVLFPICDPLHAVLAVVIFCYAVFYLLRDLPGHNVLSRRGV